MNWPQFCFRGGYKGVIQLFKLPQFSDSQDASFELLNAITGRQAFLLHCSVIPIENALQG